MAFSDGTAKWQLRKYSEADSLGGLDLQGVVNKINNQLQVKDCIVVFGDITLTRPGSEHRIEGTIPVPSGFERHHCRYWMESFKYDSGNSYPRDANWHNINQDTGLVSLYAKPSSTERLTTPYIVFAKK